MEDKFLKERMDNENIEVPDSLLPENIGNLLKQADTPADKRRKLKNKVIYNWKWRYAVATAVAAAVIFAVIGVAGRNTEVKPTYEDIYEKLEDEKLIKGNAVTMAGNFVDGFIMEVEEEAVLEATAAAAPGSSTTTDESVDYLYTNTETTTTQEAPEYSTTNLQEYGVDEGDVIKTDGNYIYVLKTASNYTKTENPKLFIFKPEGEQVEKLVEYVIEDVENYEYLSLEEMYLDGDRLALMGSAWTRGFEPNNSQNVAVAIFMDVADRSNPKPVNTLMQSGYYVSSRKSEGYIYMISSFDNLTGIREEKYESYIPMCDGELVEAESIYCPEELGYFGYTVIGAIDFNNPEGYVDNESIMLTNKDMYVSSNAIYFLSSVSGIESTESDPDHGYMMSNMVKFTYDKGDIRYLGETKVPGTTDSQFSFSEYNGYIRIVTSTNKYTKVWDSGMGKSYFSYEGRYNGLYIYDENLKLTGYVDNVAEGESLKSSRFIGNMAYFVTFKQTDPLFAVDVTDPYNPVIVGELKVSGFSEYLHPYGDGKLLGIGYEADPDTGVRECLKISMFDISDGAELNEESKILLNGSYYSPALTDHKLILADVNKNIFGFAASYDMYTSDYSYENVVMYQLFSYDEEKGFTKLVECIVDEAYTSFYPRAIYIGDYLYVIDSACNIYAYEL